MNFFVFASILMHTNTTSCDYFENLKICFSHSIVLSSFFFQYGHYKFQWIGYFAWHNTKDFYKIFTR